jgi:hypothetical protein
MSNRKLKGFFAYVLLVAVFYSCVQRPVEYEYKERIVKAKTIDLEDGNTRYNIAFTDGGSETCSFGLYSKYEVGDTICMKRENGWTWYVMDCHQQ